MPERQVRNDLGLNLQLRKDNSVEIQKNFYVLIFIETAVTGAAFDDFAVRCDDNLPRYSHLELRSCLRELGLRYNPVVIFIEFGNLRRVLYRERQCRFKAVRVLPDR